MKRNCLAGQRPTTLEEAQGHARWWLDQVCNVRIHETTHRRPVDLLEEERPHLHPLTTAQFSYLPQLSRRVYLDFTVRWKDNFYEVPFQYAGRRVLCQEFGDELSIVSEGQEIARHRLLQGIGHSAQLPEHRQGLYRSSYPSHLPYQRDSFLKLFPHHERFVEGCVKRFRGNAAYHLHKVRELITEWGHRNVDAAIEQALLMGAFHVRAVRQACRRLANLPPLEVGSPRRVLHLTPVEQRPLQVYADHVR